MLKDSNDQQMVDNFRPLQDLNDRTVYSSFNVSAEVKPTTELTKTETTTMGLTADATAVSFTAAPFLLMLVAALFKH